MPGQQPGRVVGDVQGRIGVLGQRRALRGRQPRIEDDGDDAGAQRTQHDRQQGRGRRGRDEQPVPAAHPGGREGGGRPALVPLALRAPDHGHGCGHAGRTVPSAASVDPALRPELVQRGPRRLRGGEPHLARHLGVDARHQLVDRGRTALQRGEHLPLAVGAVGEVVVEHRAGVLGQLGAVPAVEGGRPEVADPAQRLEVGHHVALGVGHHRGAAAEHVVADEHRPGLDAEGQVVRAVPRRRDDVDRGAGQLQPVPAGQHPPAGTGHVAAARHHLGAEPGTPGQRGLGVVAVVVGDQHGRAAGAARGQGRLHRLQVRGVVGARVDQHRRTAAGRTDEVGVGAVEGHAGRVGRQHPRDQRLEVRRPRHRAERRELPGATRIDGCGHARHASPGLRPATTRVRSTAARHRSPRWRTAVVSTCASAGAEADAAGGEPVDRVDLPAVHDPARVGLEVQVRPGRTARGCRPRRSPRRPAPAPPPARSTGSRARRR